MKTRLCSLAAIAAIAMCSSATPSAFAIRPCDPNCGGRSTDKYVGPGAAWSDGNNWLDQDLAHNPPSNGDDVFIGGSPGTTTTDDIASLNIPRLIFNQGSNFLSIGAGSTLIIDPTDEPTSNGVELTNGASASIEISNSAQLQFKNASSAVGVPITVDAGGAFDISSVTVPTEIGSLAGGNGTVKLGANTLTTGAVNTSTSYSGAITGTGGSLTKTGSGASTYSGSTNINTGAIDASNDTALGSSAVTIAQGTSLNVSSGGSVTIANNIAGNGGVNINPNSTSGAVSFTNANTYNGNTVIQAGTFFARNSSGSATGNGNVCEQWRDSCRHRRDHGLCHRKFWRDPGARKQGAGGSDHRKFQPS